MSDAMYVPPCEITETIINLVAEISEEIGAISAWQHMDANPRLRRDSRIRTIHATLAIENNTLSLHQVTDVINGKRVLGAPEEIREVKNAYEAYERLLSFDPYSERDLLTAHEIMMNGLVREAGRFRTGGVAVFKGEQIIHMAPPAELVAEHIGNLLAWAKSSTVHPLIKSCVFHYEFEFIHPFEDGNGRMGRMWNTLLLYRWKPVFAWIPVEAVIREHQDAYYDALARADSVANAAPFVEFMLRAILDTLREIAEGQGQGQERVQGRGRAQDAAAKMEGSPALLLMLEKLGSDELSAQELMQRMGLRNRPSFLKTYLHPALALGLSEMTIPEKRSSKWQRYRYRGR